MEQDDCKGDCEKDHVQEDEDNDGYVSFSVPGVVASNLDSFVMEVVDSSELTYDKVQVLRGLDNGQQFNHLHQD